MDAMLVILAGVTALGAAGAVLLRNLVHCALSLVAAFLGIAGIYLRLSAEFVGLSQVLVNVGGVAVLIVFAILLTRGGERVKARPLGPGWTGPLMAGAVLGVLGACVLASRGLAPSPAAEASAPMREIGQELMTRYVLPLEVVGLLLTAALIGAALLAMPEREDP
jgi:NADH-quinone oxidoreductase subunit J